MRLAIATIGSVFSLYVLMTASIIAQTGSTDHIQQLTATGGAEFALGIVGAAACFTIFWRPGVGLTLFISATLFSCLIALIYEDKNAWIWAIIYLAFTAASWAHRLRCVRRVGKVS